MGNALLHRLIAIDLDGTLLDSSHRVSVRNRGALHRAHAAGMRVVLCTGRNLTETRPILDEVGLDWDAVVTVGGALVYDLRTREAIRRSFIADDTARRFAGWLGALGYPVLWLADALECGHDGYLVDGPRWHVAYDRWIERSPCRVTRVAALPPDAAAALRISIIDDDPQLAGVDAELRTRFQGALTHNLLRAPAYELTVVEAFAPHVSKWYGIARLCEYWNLDPRRTVAIGDDVNDLAMLRAAGLGVAMGNARPDVQAAARRVVATNDDDGVAQLIDELLPA